MYFLTISAATGRSFLCLPTNSQKMQEQFSGDLTAISQPRPGCLFFWFVSLTSTVLGAGPSAGLKSAQICSGKFVGTQRKERPHGNGKG